MNKLTFSRWIALAGTLAILTACSPGYDWRSTHDETSSYTVLMPGKPVSLSREIQIGEHSVTMHMTATRIGDLRFAVGAAKMPDYTAAQVSIAAIKNTLVQNISGQLNRDKTDVTNVDGSITVSDAFEATGTKPATRMAGRVVARTIWVYQVLVVGPVELMEKPSSAEAIETFLNSFKPA